MTRLAIHLLGTFQVLRDGEPVTGFESDKVRALLAYLAVEGERPLRRETLAGLLWGDRPERDARANLRRALKNLRDAIGDRNATPSFLTITRQTLQLNPAADVWVDVAAFTRAPPAADLPASLATAAELYNGDFLAGFSLADSPAFEEWLLLQREQLGQHAQQVFRELTQRHAEQGAFEAAITAVQRQIALEPWQEAAHRQLMRLLTYTGHHGAALAHYESLRAELDKSLDTAPDARTRRLYEQIQKGEIKPLVPTAVSVRLPPQPTPFVGRADELSKLDGLIAASEHRLITIHGSGGTGKTRLALATARQQATAFAVRDGRLAPRFPDGIYFVPLAQLQSPDQMLPVLADALQFRFLAGDRETRSTQQQLLDYLGSKRLLLVMDNFEHLLAGSDLLTAVLRAAPAVQIVVTSRERLRLRWETVFPIVGLTYPAAGEKDGVPLNAFSAVQLFRQTARRVQPNFDVDGTTAEPLVALCQLVQGMPLALELAAAWIETHPLPAIAEMVRQSVVNLRTDYRDVPDRHRSMTAVFDASWQQLAAESQQVLAQLSVFQDAFSAEAAAVVANASSEILRTLQHKSLLQQQNGRYQLHPLLRQYCARKVAQDPAAETAVRDRHSAYYCDLLAEVRPQLIGPQQREAFTRIEVNVANVLVAWEWAVAQRNVDRLNEAVESLGRFYIRNGRLQEGKNAFGKAVAALTTATNLSGRRALVRCVTWLAACETDPEQARATFDRGFAFLAEGNVVELEAEKAHLLLRFGRWLLQVGEREQALQVLEESYRLFAGIDDIWWTALARGNWGLALHEMGAYERARELHAESLEVYLSLGDLAYIASVLECLAETATFQGDLSQAERWAQEAVAFHKKAGDIAGAVSASYTLAVPFFWQGEFADALRMTEETVVFAKNYGIDTALEYSFATCHMHLGNYESALKYAEQGMRHYRQLGDVRNVALSLAVLGWVAIARGNFQEGDEFLQKCEAIYHEINQRGELGWAQFARALTALGLGKRMQARRFVHASLFTAQVTHNFSIAMCTLATTAVFLAHEADAASQERAIMLYAAASNYPWLSKSRWFADVAGRHVTAVAQTLPAAQVAAAKEKGARLDLWQTVSALMDEFADFPTN